MYQQTLTACALLALALLSMTAADMTTTNKQGKMSLADFYRQVGPDKGTEDAQPTTQPGFSYANALNSAAGNTKPRPQVQQAKQAQQVQRTVSLSQWPTQQVQHELRRSKSEPSVGGKRDEFDLDYLALNLAWSAGHCRVTDKGCSNQVNSFTIHGLWPARYDNPGPTDCKSNKNRFNLREVSTIEGDLRRFWPSIEFDGPSFWTHEWNKHGTCAKTINQLKAPYFYFKKTLEMFKGLNVDRAFKEAKLAPTKGGLVSPAAVANVFRAITHTRVYLNCKRDRNSTPVLVDVRICYDTNFKFINCPETSKFCGLSMIW